MYAIKWSLFLLWVVFVISISTVKHEDAQYSTAWSAITQQYHWVNYMRKFYLKHRTTNLTSITRTIFRFSWYVVAIPSLVGAEIMSVRPSAAYYWRSYCYRWISISDSVYFVFIIFGILIFSLLFLHSLSELQLYVDLSNRHLIIFFGTTYFDLARNTFELKDDSTKNYTNPLL